MNGKRIHKKTIQVVAGCFLCSLVVAAYIIFYFPNSFSPSPKFITVSKGQSFSSVVDSLYEKGIIFGKIPFSLAGRLLGVTHSMRVGKYSFVSGVSNHEILNNIAQGFSSISTTVTLPEGLRSTVYARILKRHIGIDSVRFMELLRDTSLIGIYPHHSSSLEGYLMPETYEFFWQDDEKQIIQQMITEFRAFFVDSLQRRMKQLGVTLNEVLTMASIVEGEAVYDDERPIIAGVYYNRLRLRMPLQADPTVQYVVSHVPRRLTRNDLKVDSPYNTYLRYGLPPGPINNPSRQSILAALYPAKHSYLYFVSDNNGRHRFAKSYQEHQRNVRLYKKARQLAQNGKNQ